jgi:hypothetical protein
LSSLDLLSLSLSAFLLLLHTYAEEDAIYRAAHGGEKTPRGEKGSSFFIHPAARTKKRVIII